MQGIDPETLKPLACRYVWWQTPDEALRRPERVVAQVTDIGDHADAEALAARIGEEPLREILRRAQPGQLHPRSWAYWHYRLGMAGSDRYRRCRRGIADERGVQNLRFCLRTTVACNDSQA